MIQPLAVIAIGAFAAAAFAGVGSSKSLARWVRLEVDHMAGASQDRQQQASQLAEHGTVYDLAAERLLRRRRNYCASAFVLPDVTGRTVEDAPEGKLLAMPPREHEMTPEVFRATLAQVLGGRGWQTAFARGTGLHFSTISRYLSRELPIPQHIAVLVLALAALDAAGRPLPAPFDRRGDADRLLQNGD